MKKRDRNKIIKEKYDRLTDPWYEHDKKFIETCNAIIEVYGKKQKKLRLKAIK